MPVYQDALGLLRLTERIAASLPRFRADLARQLRRACESGLLNIAEGAGDHAPLEKARIYRIARRSFTETAAGIDIVRTVEPALAEDCDRARLQALHVTGQLSALILTHVARSKEGDKSASPPHSPRP